MNTDTLTNEVLENHEREMPGKVLARAREEKGYTQEYVAGKLHLRVRVIQLLEADNYQQMPEPVFIKGYIRAYAKLLGASADELLAVFNSFYSAEKKLEKTLWQSRREVNRGEHLVRWLTGLVAIGLIVAIGIWWQKNKDNQPAQVAKNTFDAQVDKKETDIRLTDLSKMRPLSSSVSSIPVELQSG